MAKFLFLPLVTYIILLIPNSESFATSDTNFKFDVPLRDKRALQKSHEKPQAEKWMDKFFGKGYKPEKQLSLVNLIYTVTRKYLSRCVPIVLYDEEVRKTNYVLFSQLFKKLPTTTIHGMIVNNTVQDKRLLQGIPKYCRSFVVFIPDIMNSPKILGRQHMAYVMVISSSSQWRIQEFLGKSDSHAFINLLIVGESYKSSFRQEDTYILYTHKLYVDGLGSSAPHVLTSWSYNRFLRPKINLFPPKTDKGVSGHRFIVALADKPPFVIKQIKKNIDGSNAHIAWDGVEVRLIELISKYLNFTLEFKEVTNLTLGPSVSVTKKVKSNQGDVGLAGIYVTSDLMENVDVTHGHSFDCASFLTLTSTALPRYRAIMGPFHWSVWVAMTLTYLFGIIPLSFSDKHSLRHLIDNPANIEDMFWYVFGTFTNCFTFVGEQSWSKSKKITTRLLIGWYWVYTIIITACYTGSIIAFVTLPVFPETIDTVEQLIDDNYRVLILDNDGWNHWYENSRDERVEELFDHVKYVPDVATAISNITHAFFWKYTFLGSKANLEFIVQTNYSRQIGKRDLFHVSDECFVPYSVAMIFPHQSVYKSAVNKIILRALQSGLLTKILRDVQWDLYRTVKGGRMKVSSSNSLKIAPAEDKALTLDDTQGMFLLLGAGFLIGAASLVSEYVGGCVNYCKQKRFLNRQTRDSITSAMKSLHLPTPRYRKSPPTSGYDHWINESISDVANLDSNNSSKQNSSNVLVHKEPVENKIDENGLGNHVEEKLNEFKQMPSKNSGEKRSDSATNKNIDKSIDKMFDFDEYFGGPAPPTPADETPNKIFDT